MMFVNKNPIIDTPTIASDVNVKRAGAVPNGCCVRNVQSQQNRGPAQRGKQIMTLRGALQQPQRPNDEIAYDRYMIRQ